MTNETGLLNQELTAAVHEPPSPTEDLCIVMASGEERVRLPYGKLTPGMLTVYQYMPLTQSGSISGAKL